MKAKDTNYDNHGISFQSLISLNLTYAARLNTHNKNLALCHAAISIKGLSGLRCLHKYNSFNSVILIWIKRLLV